MLEAVDWLQHDSIDEFVPLVGKTAHAYEAVVKLRSDMQMGQETLRKLRPSRSGRQYVNAVSGWTLGSQHLRRCGILQYEW